MKRPISWIRRELASPGFVFFASCLLLGTLASFTVNYEHFSLAVRPSVGLATIVYAMLGRRLALFGWCVEFALAYLEFAQRPHLTTAEELLPYMALVATATTIQCLLAASLVKYCLGREFALSSLRDVSLFLLIVGPLTPVFGATARSIYLTSQLIQPSTNLWILWLYTWTPEVLGGLLFAPLAIAFLGRPRSLWENRRRNIVVPLIMMNLILVIGYFGIRNLENARLNQEIQDDSTTSSKEFQQQLRMAEGILSRFQFLSRPEVFEESARDNWMEEKMNLQKELPWCEKMTVVAYLTPDEYERRSEVNTKLKPIQRTTDGRLIPGPRQPYFLKTLDYPRNPGLPKGYDYGTEPIWKSLLNQAMYQRSCLAKYYPAEAETSAHMRVVVPVWRRNSRSVSRDNDVPLGFVLFDMDLAQACLEFNIKDSRGILVTIPDGTGDFTMKFFDESIPLGTRPSPGYLAFNRPNFMLVGGLIGILLAVMMTGMLLSTTGREAAIEETIKTRTLELRTEIQQRKEIEAHLSLNEARLREMQRISSLGYWEWLVPTDVFTCSPLFLELLGYSQVELGSELGHFLDLVHPDDVPELLLEIQELQVLPHHREAEYRVVARDGNWRWFTSYIASLETPEGVLIRATAMDITDRKNKDLDLKASEQHQRMALEVGQMGTLIWMTRVQTIRWDDRMLALLGRERTEMQPSIKCFLACVHPEDRREVEKQFAKLQTMPETERCHCEFRVFTGLEPRWLSGQGRRVPGKDGVEEKIIAIFFDITARKVSEERLKNQEDRLQEAQRLTKVGSFELDYRTTEVFWSDEMYRILGYKPQSVDPTYQNFISRVHPDDRALVESRLEATIHRREPYQYEVRIIRPDGQNRILAVQGKMVYGEHDEPLSFVGTNQDITDRKEIEESLRLTKNRLLEAQNLSLVGAWEWNPDTDIVWMSDQFYKNVGLPIGTDVSGSEIRKRVPKEDQGIFDIKFREAEESRNPVDWEYRMLRFDTNEERCFRIRVVSHSPNNARIIFLCTSQDITDSKREEAERLRFQEQITQMQRLESLGILAGGVAHDFNNLLSGILGNANIAREVIPADSELHEFLRPIEKSAEHAAQLCHQMLEYAGRGQGPQHSTVDLDAVITDSIEILKAAVSKKHIFEPQLNRMLPFIDGNSSQISQIVMNLVQNAAEALLNAGGKISIRTFSTSQFVLPTEDTTSSGTLPEGEVVVLEIADTGSGMTENTRERIFEPFFTTKFTGRGLGLSAVHGIVRSHNATIAVTSRLGQGTTFRIVFPISVSQGRETEQLTRTPAPMTWDSLNRRKAIIIDDDSTVRGIAAFSLKGLGFTVLEASDGEEGLELFRKDPHSISLVVTDVVMPKLDGRGVLDAVRAIRSDVPVIMISGYNESQLSDLVFGSRLNFLHKPFRAMDLSMTVRRMVHSTDATESSRPFPTVSNPIPIGV
ncbi:MAG: PAS domain-containing protein [Fimbriiglobus sp.]